MTTVTELPNLERGGMQAALESAKRNLPVMIEYEVIKAQIAFAGYRATVAAGFSEEQAMQIAIARIK